MCEDKKIEWIFQDEEEKEPFEWKEALPQETIENVLLAIQYTFGKQRTSTAAAITILKAYLNGILQQENGNPEQTVQDFAGMICKACHSPLGHITEDGAMTVTYHLSELNHPLLPRLIEQTCASCWMNRGKVREKEEIDGEQ